MNKQHHYNAQITWTGNTGTGTSGYTQYKRDFTASVEGKPDLECCSDPAFRGDPSRYNPEDMLLCSLSSCHMLWYLHLCADNGIVVSAYIDKASGVMEEIPGGGGRFKEVNLYPVVEIGDAAQIALADKLHEAAGEKCFIAQSCNFPVKVHPQTMVKSR